MFGSYDGGIPSFGLLNTGCFEPGYGWKISIVASLVYKLVCLFWGLASYMLGTARNQPPGMDQHALPINLDKFFLSLERHLDRNGYNSSTPPG